MARRRLATLIGRGARTPPTAKYTEHVGALLSRRDGLMNEIAAIRTCARAPAPLIDKADALLTRFWASATWRSREEILRSARWLLTIGTLQCVLESAPGRVRRKRAGGKRAPARTDAT